MRKGLLGVNGLAKKKLANPVSDKSQGEDGGSKNAENKKPGEIYRKGVGGVLVQFLKKSHRI